MSPLPECLWPPNLIKYKLNTNDKLNTLYLHLQKTNKHHTRQGSDLQWEASILKATWPFDYVTNVRPRNNFKNLYFHYHKSYGQETWLGANLAE